MERETRRCLAYAPVRIWFCPRLEMFPSKHFGLGTASHPSLLLRICSGAQNGTRDTQVSRFSPMAKSILCPREESNFYYEIRNLASYPLNDEGNHPTLAGFFFFFNFQNISKIPNDLK